MPIKINNYSAAQFTTVVIYDLLILYYCIITLVAWFAFSYYWEAVLRAL